MQEILAKLEEQGFELNERVFMMILGTLRDFWNGYTLQKRREGGYYEEKSASDKTEADNTTIHQPDGETGEKSENVQETDWKEDLKHLQRSIIDTLPKQERI